MMPRYQGRSAGTVTRPFRRPALDRLAAWLLRDRIYAQFLLYVATLVLVSW